MEKKGVEMFTVKKLGYFMCLPSVECLANPNGHLVHIEIGLLRVDQNKSNLFRFGIAINVPVFSLLAFLRPEVGNSEQSAGRQLLS